MKKPRNQEAKKPRAISILSVVALLMAISFLLIAGCDPANNDPFAEQIVLQGQMYVGNSPVIRLTRTIPLEERYDSSRVGVSGASVELIAGIQRYHLADRGSGYYGLAATDTHTVTPGMQYSITCIAGQHTLTAETRAAGFMQFTQPASDTDTTVVVYDSVSTFVMRWPHDNFARGHWAIYENINPHHADDSTWLEANNAGPDKRVGVYATYWNIPPTVDSLNSPPILFNRTGLHRVRVFSCDSALWYFASTFQPGQADIEPISNVHGGLGVFTAGGVDTTYFYLAKKPK